MKHTADVVVIGAGIQGLSAAYHLAKKGMTNVVVVEMETIGSGSSGRSASMLMLQMWSEWSIRMSLYDFDRYMHFEDEFGVKPDYQKTGTMALATPEVAQAERELVALRRRLGVETEVLTPDEIHRRWPLILPDGLELASYGPLDGNIEAQSIMLGYKGGLTRLGGVVLQGVKATNIRTEHGRVLAVDTTAGEIACQWVVNAAGMWAAEVGAWAGVSIPIQNRTRNIYVTDKVTVEPAIIPFVYDMAEQWYFRREGHGMLVGHGKRAGIPARMEIDRAYLPTVFAMASERVPLLGEVGVASGWTGVRPLSPDEAPILGPVAGVAGYINNCCWGGEGIMHSPMGGQLTAEWIVDGATSTFPSEQFLLSRFG